MAKKPVTNKAPAIDHAIKPRRNMFSELMEGMEALKAQRLGKCMLPTHVVKRRLLP